MTTSDPLAHVPETQAESQRIVPTQSPGKKGRGRKLTIPPYTRFIGQQLAGWQPTASSQPQYDLYFEADVEILLPDGTTLIGDLYRPNAAGSFPTLLAWSSYTKELQNTGLPMPINEVGQIGYFVRRGYAHLTVNARGTGKSGGERAIHFAPSEQRDVADTIEWIARQAWCDGNVGMIGMSYFAAIQYLAAAQQPPHLKAIFPYLGFTDMYRGFMYHGGALHSGFLAPFYTFVGSTQKLSVPPRLRHLASYILHRDWIQRQITSFFFRNEEKMPNQMHPERSWMKHFATLAFDEPYDGPFYREKSAWPVLDRIQIPICIGTNWGNPSLHMRGAFQAWAAVTSPHKLLFIGPPDPRWPWANYQQEALAWYDYHLKGLDTGIKDVPCVRYWLQGANRWCEATNWPIPDAVKQRVYLTVSAQDPFATQSLQTQLPEQTDTASFVAITRGMRYPRELEQYETQVLRYETLPFQADTEVVGPISLSLTLSSTAIDTHIIARVSDLAPDGKCQKLSFGWLQASHRKVDLELSRPDEIIHEHRTPESLVPGQPTLLTFSLNPTANLFKQGHRLILEIGSRPDILGTTTFEGFIYFPYEAPPYPARNKIYHGGEHPSYLEFEVRP